MAILLSPQFAVGLRAHLLYVDYTATNEPMTTRRWPQYGSCDHSISQTTNAYLTQSDEQLRLKRRTTENTLWNYLIDPVSIRLTV